MPHHPATFRFRSNVSLRRLQREQLLALLAERAVTWLRENQDRAARRAAATCAARSWFSRSQVTALSASRASSCSRCNRRSETLDRNRNVAGWWGMNRQQLRAAQTPLKERYRGDPAAARGEDGESPQHPDMPRSARPLDSAAGRATLCRRVVRGCHPGGQSPRSPVPKCASETLSCGEDASVWATTQYRSVSRSRVLSW